jgi:hypothetical protein
MWDIAALGRLATPGAARVSNEAATTMAVTARPHGSIRV